MVRLSTDVTRKTRAGLEPTRRPPAAMLDKLYGPETTRRTYAALRRQARRWLQRGVSVILDGTYSDPRERALARGLARRLGARFVLVQTTCPDAVVKTRMAARASDPGNVSDADWEIYTQARTTFRAPDELPASERIVDPSGGADVDSVIRRLLTDVHSSHSR
jgi:predicted kinase